MQKTHVFSVPWKLTVCYTKLGNDGLILSSSQFLLLPQLPQKMKPASKVVEITSKIIGLLTTIQICETHCAFNPRLMSSINDKMHHNALHFQ
jgi:hypothetical protein